jgi:hypothetical protein
MIRLYHCGALDQWSDSLCATADAAWHSFLAELFNV